MTKVYVFATDTAAEAFKLTAYHFNYDLVVKRIGSALIMPEEAYATVIEKTYATPAAIVAVKDDAAAPDLLKASKALLAAMYEYDGMMDWTTVGQFARDEPAVMQLRRAIIEYAAQTRNDSTDS